MIKLSFRTCGSLPKPCLRSGTRGKLQNRVGLLDSTPSGGRSQGVTYSAASAGADMGTIVEPSVFNKGITRAVIVAAAVAASGFGGTALPSVAALAIHVGAAGIWLGTNIWTTFFAGITMYKNLSRQTFGKLQAKLFPLYFALLTFCSGAALVTTYFGPLAPIATPFVQNVLILGVVTAASNLFFIEPAATAVLFQRYKLENSSDAVAKKEEREALTKQFGKFHGLSSLANLGNLAAAFSHLVWLASLVKGSLPV